MGKRNPFLIAGIEDVNMLDEVICLQCTETTLAVFWHLSGVHSDDELYDVRCPACGSSYKQQQQIKAEAGF